ncbi:OmpH family outer membrane protein [Aquimarina sp. MMG015]|uniref:OmpH family outer membrane protein n=1 Tax=Aquimarina TaxID=290174 RepID=UPI00041EF3B0|nr:MULTISPECIES: OmpH family outer membrane protein [Aquimarina]AXT57854.1 OmpH family outer membrane protein [Aquimarina sp. AD1]MBQ4803203.1 OmpH family outer membrane protein [Aquimarina sp. MMG015]RKN34987.1 OmpH family outer membrane protein [Aquimarina sp. AD1]
MKTKVLLVLAAILWLSFSNTAEAQKGIRVGYIDMDYILENVPEYNEASADLETKVQKWKVEIEAELKEVEEMRKDLNNERVLLTKELIEEREEDIFFREKEILEYQQKRFGPNGDLFIQKKRLVQPVQDQVFVAVQEVAKNKKYDFIFDKSADLVMLYSADRHDISDQILLRINRASKRKQVNSKKEKKALERAEKRNSEQEKEVTDREKSTSKKQAEREKLLAERKAARDSIRAAKKKEFEARRAKLLEAQKRKKDSITALKEKLKNDSQSDDDDNKDGETNDN